LTIGDSLKGVPFFLNLKNLNYMKKEFIIEVLTKIKELNHKVHLLYKLGVNIIDLDLAISTLEKTIPTIIVNEKNDAYNHVSDLVGWWLYENVDKVITMDEKQINVETMEDFVNFLIKNY
jgi:hypothetical protein